MTPETFAPFIGDRPPTLEELERELRKIAAEHPQVSTLREIGRSRAGRPMTMLTIPGGHKHVLVVGAPHPNEPIGLAVIPALARYLAEHPEDRETLTWHLVGCADPDGVAANEDWWSSTWPPTMESYHRGMYRPPAAEQPEWTFPTESFTSTLPETRALMAVIDGVLPALTVSLHGSDTGGVWAMASHDEPALPQSWQTSQPGMACPSRRRPQTASVSPPSGPAPTSWHLLSTPKWSETAARTASTSGSHGRQQRPLHRQARPRPLPGGPDMGVHSLRLSPQEAIGVLEDARHVLGDLIAEQTQALNVEAGFLTAAEEIRSIIPVMIRNVQHQPVSGSGQDLVLLVPVRAAGMLLRHYDQLLATNPYSDQLHEARAKTEAVLLAWCHRAEKALRPQPLPLFRTAGYQADLVLTMARTLLPGRAASIDAASSATR